MRKISIFIVLFTFISFSAQVTEKYKTSVEPIFNTFKGKNYDLIKSILAPNVKVGSLSVNNDEIIPQVINQFPAPLSYTVELPAQLIVVDGHFFAEYGASLKKLTDSLGKPVTRFYLSHGHPDHYLGFGDAFPNADVYALKETKDEIYIC